MATTPDVNSNLTRQELAAIVDDFSDYDLVKSVDRCKVYIKAARILLRRTPQRVSSVNRGEEVEQDASLEAQLTAAVEWLRINEPLLTGGASGVRYGDFRNFREDFCPSGRCC